MLEILKRIKNIIENYELLFELAAKEIKIRYKHLVLGLLWVLIVPLSIIAIFKIIFSVILKVSFGPYPFFVFLATAIFPWSFFNLSVSNTILSSQDNSNLIKKVYFPREIIPISVILANLINFLFTLLIVFLILLVSKIRFTANILYLPLVVGLEIIFTVGVCLIFSGLQARFRDIKYMVEVLLLFWFYLTPIFYPLSMVADRSSILFNIYMLNPLTQIITLYRVVLLGGYVQTLPPGFNLTYLVGLSVFSCSAVFFLGFLSFRKIDPYFADLV